MRLMDIVNALSFKPLSELNSDEQLRILSLRNQKEIRRNMYTSHEISADEHSKWIERMKHDAVNRFFAVVLDGQIVGAISLNAISADHRRADWAYYIDGAQQGRGIGSALELKFLEYVFNETNIRKLNAEVFEFNEKVIALHKKFGFRQEGIRREHIRRDDEALDVCLIGITKAEWQAKRAELVEGSFK